MARKKFFQISQDLTKGLEDTVNAAHVYSGSLRVEAVSLEKIELDPDNPRNLALTLADLTGPLDKSDPLLSQKQQELIALQSLTESIKREGILNPVLVYKYMDHYRLVAGERRTLASVLAGKTSIQAKILDTRPTEYKLSLLQWVENMEREDLTLWERIKNLEKIVTCYQNETTTRTLSPTILRTIIGCSLPHAMNYCAILEADDVIKRLIQANKIKNLEKAALLTKLTQPKLKQHAVEACLKGATLKELKQLARTEKQLPMASSIVSSNKATRGRIAKRINLGATQSLSAIKFLIDTVLATEKYRHLQHQFPNINWTNYKSVTDVFKKLVQVLAENE